MVYFRQKKRIMADVKKRILIVDDEPDVIEFLAYNFRKQGYEVKGAGSGSEGLEVIRSFVPHLIIADIMMPGMSGIALGASIRKHAGYKDLPLIFLSAIQDDYGVMRAGILADEFVSKPVRFPFLLHLVEKHLKTQKTSQ